MANLEKRKRQRPEDLSPNDRPTKKRQTDRPRSRPNFPPEFWDDLTKVWLTPRALRELDRRNSKQPSSKPSSAGVSCKDLGRFARHGGPDLRHLRGFSKTRLSLLPMATESSRSSRTNPSTHATSVTPKTRRSSAYDVNFGQRLIDFKIYPEGHFYGNNRPTPEPDNVDRVRESLAVSRASLSPSRFTESQFQDFKQKNARVISEDKVMSDILPIIHGSASIENERNLLFTNIESITEKATVGLKPDFYDGAPPDDVNETVRSKLQKHIIPTKHAKAPIVPNYFLEAKAPRGGLDVAKRQITHDLAVGARGMHSLQNYGVDEPGYDGNAYAYGSTYHAGTLKLYATHMTTPTAPGTQPEYHITELDGFYITGNRKAFIQGATAQRNLRDLANTHRYNFIQSANARAQAEADALLLEEQSAEAIVELGASQSLDHGHSREDVEPVVYGASQNVEEIPETVEHVNDLEEPEDDSQVLAGYSEASASLATSVASSSAPKRRHRSSRCPPSASHKRQGYNKGRKPDAVKS